MLLTKHRIADIISRFRTASCNSTSLSRIDHLLLRRRRATLIGTTDIYPEFRCKIAFDAKITEIFHGKAREMQLLLPTLQIFAAAYVQRCFSYYLCTTLIIKK